MEFVEWWTSYEKNTNLKIGKLYICWFHETNKKYEVIECKDFSEEINQLVKLNKI
jgi:hypothetical protein